MLKIKNLFMVTLAGAALMQACNNDKVGETQTTESGLQYTYLREGEGQQPDSGQVLTVHMMYTTEGDSVIFDSRKQNVPLGVPAKDPNMEGMLAEGFQMLKKGDSVEFVVPAQDFFTQTARMPVPGGINENENLVFHVGVVDVMSEDAFREQQMEQYRKQQEQALQEQQEQLGRDVKTIEDFLAENNIQAQKTDAGLYYKVDQKGTGPEIDAGDEVTVHYRGKLLDGTPFDASYDRNEPFTFTVGQGMVIRGWDEALQELREGSKATLYIPSPLAYGSRSAGPVIKPNSILIFDVEVLDVKE
jgi:FKBP-type peptidyl-prolyl cis-trans isomerase FkpA